MSAAAGTYLLDVWLSGVHVAELRERRTGAAELRYTEEALDQFRRGAPVVSVSLPARPEPYSPGVVRPFLEGMLPEGEARTALERQCDVRRGDLYGLLAAIGRDCAGAISFCAPGEAPPPAAEEPRGTPFADDDLAAAIRALPESPLGDDEDVRISLAGQQPKLVVARHAETGSWMRPVGGSPSTHIIKPEPPHLPGMVANEAFCLRVAAGLGLTPVEVSQIVTGAGRALVVSRYDRVIEGSGMVRRRHQEDMVQALGVDLSRAPTAKYEEHGGPRLADIAQVLDRHGSEAVADLERLLRSVVLHIAVGNADAHAKNVSIMLDGEGRVRLAPVYDVACALVYKDLPGALGPQPVNQRLAMSVNGSFEMDEVSAAALVAEGAGWPGLSSRRAAAVVEGTVGELAGVVDAAAKTTRDLDRELLDLVGGRVARLADPGSTAH